MTSGTNAGHLRQKIEAVQDVPLARLRPLGGGSVSVVYRADLEDGRSLVAKWDSQGTGQLELEADMLTYLATNSDLPVPAVVHSEPNLLLLEHLPGTSSFSVSAQRHAAGLLASLHAVSGPAFGFERDTLIGGLHQPNPWTESWIDFFREQRLLYMGVEAVRTGRLPTKMMARLERFCGQLDHWLTEPERPSLIHGDAWTGNILADGEKITAFLDPAIYFADPEIELAFTTLFATFGETFFNRYSELCPIRPDFMEVRRHIYNLYPLLVHVRLFGGTYVAAIDRTLKRLGI